MIKNKFGHIALEIDQRLANLTPQSQSGELKVTEAEFFHAIKGYRLDESLVLFSDISKKIFCDEYPKEWHRMSRGGIRHPCGIFITQFAIEYFSNAIIVSGSNNWKKESLKSKDNILGLFNIYHNGLTQVRSKHGICSLLIPMFFEQFVSQAEPKDVFTRQWYMFYKINRKFDGQTFDNLSEIFLKQIGLSILEYTKLCFLIYATIITSPRFNIGKLTGSNIKGLDDVLNEEKMSTFLNFVSADYDLIRKLDRNVNGVLDPNFTKTRFNPLWLKPIIRMGENDYLAPSITAYMTSTFKGLFWWFDSYFRKHSLAKVNRFRSYFGSLFEEYVGDVIKDIYVFDKVLPQINYGTKKTGGKFFDWIVETKTKTFLFEVKAYQFPLDVLQKGDDEKIRIEVVNKIVNTIIQMFKRVGDINGFESLSHLRSKNAVPIAVFYDIPFISTPMYQENILPALISLEHKYPGIKDFKYYMMSIEELEDYYYVSDQIDIDNILKEVNKNAQTGFRAELAKINGGKLNVRKNILDRAFNEYCSGVIGVSN